MLKFFIFNEIKLIQSSNIDSISVTFDVSKLDKSKYFNDLQFLNISHIISTFLVLKEDKSNDINNVKSLNIPFILVINSFVKLFFVIVILLSFLLK